MICCMAGERGRQGKERVTQQAGEEENPYFSKVEVATRAVLNLVFRRCVGKGGPFKASKLQCQGLRVIFPLLCGSEEEENLIPIYFQLFSAPPTVVWEV